MEGRWVSVVLIAGYLHCCFGIWVYTNVFFRGPLDINSVNKLPIIIYAFPQQGPTTTVVNCVVTNLDGGILLQVACKIGTFVKPTAVLLTRFCANGRTIITITRSIYTISIYTSSNNLYL